MYAMLSLTLAVCLLQWELHLAQAACSNARTWYNHRNPTDIATQSVETTSTRTSNSNKIKSSTNESRECQPVVDGRIELSLNGRNSTSNQSVLDENFNRNLTNIIFGNDRRNGTISSQSDPSGQYHSATTSLSATGGSDHGPFKGISTSDPKVADALGPELTINDFRDFRLEYNKYKILSSLGLLSNPETISPKIDEDLRTKLTATSALSDSSNIQSVSRKFFHILDK